MGETNNEYRTRNVDFRGFRNSHIVDPCSEINGVENGPYFAKATNGVA